MSNNFTDENGCLDLSKHNNITGATFTVVYHKDEITTHTFSVCIIIEHNFDEHGICKCGEVSSSHVHEYEDGECIYCHAKQEHICDFNEDDITTSENEEKEIFSDIISLLHCFAMRMYSSRRKKKITLVKEDLENEIGL